MDRHRVAAFSSSPRKFFSAAVLLIGFIAIAATLPTGCSSNVTGVTSGMATANVMVSDPATCQAPSGPFSNVYVTITDVKASVNTNAGDTDSSWVDLTPNLSKSPMQIDLLGQANNQCFLASLGATTQLQAGNYQQIRIYLADNSTTVSGNKCTGAANCVVTSAGNFPLQLSSESKTGIKIPSGQIANGGFNISAGQTKDLDIDFNTCISIVQEGNGKYRLKPVLHAGEVSTTSTSINGTVLDNATGNPVNGSVLVALEQKDSTGVDRVFMSTLTNSSGQFVFCPLPAGTYDVVIVGESTSGVAYAPTVITGVSTGSALSTVKLYPQVTTTAPVTLKGSVTTQVSTSPAVATASDIEISALEQVSSTLTVTIPLLPNTTQSSATLALHTATGGSCASGLDCASYSIVLPAATSYIGTFSASGTTLSVSAVAASYTVDALAFIPSSGGSPDCTPPEMKSSAIAPAGGTTANVPAIAFTGCTAGY
ncbi:MAG TPA: DUF4382 domain-containing protein [Acidobacteriaceae bacterium]|nr:DUF4382 domain-containing protein [Acidobacteriaceae bacterium]